MMKLRLQLTKGVELSYISHLDYARAIERACRRAKLPVAYSEGFNPHMKFALASALAVGVTSEAEYVDVELNCAVKADEALTALQKQMPSGLKVLAARYLDYRTPALMAVINLAIYRLTVPDNSQELVESIAAFNAAEQVIYCKESPKGRREVDLKKYIRGSLQLVKTEAETASITVGIIITQSGSIKPVEVVAALVEQFALPVKLPSVRIHRTALLVVKDASVLTPLEL